MQNRNKKTSNKKRSGVKTIKTTKITKNNLNKKSDNSSKENTTNTLLVIVGIIILAIVAVLIFRLTWAYFTANVIDANPGEDDIVIDTADLRIHYEDGSSNMEFGDRVEPGDIIAKEFKVVNDGTDTGMYTIVLEGINHNLGHYDDEVFVSDVKYTLSKLDDSNNKTLMSTGTLPFNSSKEIIYTVDKVDYNKTNKYLLEVEYINHSNIDQSDSMGEKLELKINIVDYEDEMRTTE